MTHKTRWIAAAGGLLAVAIPVAPAHAVQFSPPFFVNELRGAASFDYGDLDRDGDLDLAVAPSTGTDDVLVRLNNTPALSGTPDFGPVIRIDMGSQRPNVVRIAELDGDLSGPEIVTGNSSTENPTANAPAVAVLRNRSANRQLRFLSSGTSQDPTNPAFVSDPDHFDPRIDSTTFLEVIDADNSGGRALDVLYGNTESGRLTVLRELYSGNAEPLAMPVKTEAQPGLPPKPFADATFADLNREGRPELVVANRSGTVGVRQDDPGTPELDYIARADQPTGFNSLSAIEPLARDGDRGQDVLVSSAGPVASVQTGGIALLANATTTRDDPRFAAPRTIVPNRNVTDIRVTNFNTDATLDVVGSKSNGDAVVLRRGPAGDEITDHPGGASGSAVETGDFNGDGDTDVSVLDPSASRAAIALQSPDVDTTLNRVVKYIEDQAPVQVDPGVTVTAPGRQTIERASVRVSGGTGGDLLAVTDPRGLQSSYDAASGTLTLAGAASTDDYTAALRSVVFSVPGDRPSTDKERVFAFTASSKVTSPAANVKGIVEAINDAGSVLLSGPSGPLAVPQDAAIDPGMRITDPDSDILRRATFRIVSGFDARSDLLLYTERDDIKSVGGSEPGTLILEGSQTLAVWQSALRSVRLATRPGGSTAPREIEVRITDSEGLTGPAATRTLGARPAAAGGWAPSGGPAGGAPAARGAVGGARQSGTSSGSSLPRVFSIRGASLRDGRIRLTVQAPRAGRLDVAKLVSRRRTQLSASRTPVRAGTTTITLRPTSVVRRLVRDRGLAVLNLRVVYRPRSGAAVRRVVRVVVRRVVITRAQALSSGRIRLTVKAPFAGRLSIARVRSGRTTALSARTVRVRRGTTRVTLTPTAAARKLVRSRGALRLTLRGTYRPTSRTKRASRETVRVTLRRR